ncbi:transmembrane protein 222-like [Anneissia japonica]|uniref:transmembrane protein 222-like n=1 Tax=Anneissia japonica TaxID=1529436 RepID=UPI001425975C|nr:transmembrane protein 222-like [Anneissia japonica]
MADNQNFESDGGVEVEVHVHEPNKMEKSSSVQMFQHPIIDHRRCRYPYCIVWTPIPLLTWLFPFIGHMGIATSAGVIRDFAGPYFVSEDNMAFGRPTRYLILKPRMDKPGIWDQSVFDASEEYKTRMHNLCCDNCHSHVAMALNDMRYQDSKQWNMVKLAAKMFFTGKYVGVCGVVKTWLPSLIFYGLIAALVIAF